MKRGVTPGKVHDSVSYLRRLDRQRERFALDVKAMGLNAGYANAPIAQGLEERKILGVTGYLRRSPAPRLAETPHKREGPCRR